MSKVDDFVSMTQELRNEIYKLIDKYNEMGKEVFGSTWVTTYRPSDFRVQLNLPDELIYFEPSPSVVPYIDNSLGYQFSDEVTDFFDGVCGGVRIVESIPIGASPYNKERSYID